MGEALLKKEYLCGNIAATVSREHGFGTDAVLLAAFAAPKKQEKLCDLGTGCGILPLLWCARGHRGEISAVDIQENACNQLNIAVEENSLHEQIKVINADLRNLRGVLPFGYFDAVTMNPPYKSAGAGIENPHQALRIARHEVMCNIYDVVKAASELLRFSGRLCLCHRPERLCDIFDAMRKFNVEPKRLRFAVQNEGSAAWLVCVEGRRGGKPGLRVEPQLVIKDKNGKNTKEMAEILGEYGEGHN